MAILPNSAYYPDFGLGTSPLEQERYRRERELEAKRQVEELRRYALMMQAQQMAVWPLYSEDKERKHKTLLEKIDSLKTVESVRIPTRMPDHVQTLTGWRGWRADGEKLTALGKTSTWEPKKATRAQCLGIEAQHKSAPQSECTCGYWSFKSMDLLQEALKEYADRVVVVGSVEIWGRVIECENGYRSEYAYPKELWLLKPGLEYLSWEYGVPIRQV